MSAFVAKRGEQRLKVVKRQTTVGLYDRRRGRQVHRAPPLLHWEGRCVQPNLASTLNTDANADQAAGIKEVMKVVSLNFDWFGIRCSLRIRWKRS